MMNESENSDSDAQTGGGRASLESLSEFLKEFKSARMSFEPLDTWLFVKDYDDHTDSVSDCNDVSASSESDSSVVYQFDSDETSSDDCDDSVADTAHHLTLLSSDTSSVQCHMGDDDDKENAFVIHNLANSPGRSGYSAKISSEVDRSNVFEECEHFSLRNNVKSIEILTTGSAHQALSPGCRECTDDTSDTCEDHMPEATQRANVTYRNNRYHSGICNALHVSDEIKLSSKKSHEFSVDANTGSYCHLNQTPLTSEPVYRTMSDHSSAECNSSDLTSTGEADRNDTVKRKKKRQRIAQELMDTEATYQRHLELIVQV